MSETLGDKKRRFARKINEWETWVHQQGWALTFGEATRTNEQAEINAMGAKNRARLCSLIESEFHQLACDIGDNVGSGIRNSLHELGLARDYNLFRRTGYTWVYVEDTEAPEWQLAGQQWEIMGPDHRWGGRFGDGDHLSIEHEGRK